MGRLLSILILASLAAVPLATAEPRTETRSYVGSLVTQCASGVNSVNVGSACIRLKPDDAGRPATLSMIDDVLGGVAAGYWFQRGGALIESGTMCGTKDVVVPEGATIVLVFSVAPSQSDPLACNAVSVAGEITVTIR